MNMRDVKKKRKTRWNAGKNVKVPSKLLVDLVRLKSRKGFSVRPQLDQHGVACCCRAICTIVNCKQWVLIFMMNKYWRIDYVTSFNTWWCSTRPSLQDFGPRLLTDSMRHHGHQTHRVTRHGPSADYRCCSCLLLWVVSTARVDLHKRLEREIAEWLRYGGQVALSFIWILPSSYLCKKCIILILIFNVNIKDYNILI